MSNRTNSALIDPERGVFRVLNLIDVSLGAGLWWFAEDMDTAEVKGAIFRGHLGNSEHDNAYLIVADATADPEEPRIENLDSKLAEEIDQVLRLAITRLRENQGMRVTEWMGSHPNTYKGRAALVTAYKILDPIAGLRQIMTSRILHAGRKIVIEAAFDIAAADRLARPMFISLHPVRLLPLH